jgi:hypothetical protein
MRALVAGVLLLAGCNTLFGIPGSGELIGDGGDDDAPPPDVNCQATPQNCALLGVDRVIAKDGEVITLEGTFGDVVSVMFPDGTATDADMVGSHRARVVVPPGTSNGAIQISTAGVTVGRLPFRGTSYRVGLTHFQVEYPQTHGARQSPSLLTARGGAAMVTVRNRVFVIGGQTATAALREIEVATINADGTLSQFATRGGLLGNRAGATAHVLGDRVHVLGGRPTLTGALATTEAAPIDQEGELGPFSAGPSLTTGRAGHGSVVIGNSLYVIGGIGADGSALASIERATIAPDGTLGTFTVVDGISLVEARGTPAVVVIRDRLYVLGGTSGDGIGPLASVEQATINADGTLQAFEAVSSMSTPRGAHGAFAFSDKLVVIGGLGDNLMVERTVEQAQIQANGDLGSFVLVPTPTEVARAGATYTIAGNMLYAVGGLTRMGPAPTALASVEHTSLISSADLGLYTETGVSIFNPARIGFSIEAIGNNLYVLGGAQSGNPVGAIERASVSPTGAVGPFMREPGGLNGVRSRHVTAVAGNRLTIVGGIIAAGSAASSSTQDAAITDEGTLSTFFGQTASLVNPRQDATSAIVGTRLFVFGGADSGAPFASTESAAFNTSGSISGFSNSVSMSSARKGHCTAVIGTFVYHIGGDTGGIATSTVERMTITNGVLSSGTQLSGTTLTSVRGTVTCAVIGRFLYVFGSDNVDGRRVERAPIDPMTFDLGAFTVVMPLRGPKFETRALDLGNGLFLFGGNDGSGNLLDAVDRADLR